MHKVLHILDHSLPQQSGYASRSHAILRALMDSDLEVEAITSPKHGNSPLCREDIDNVCYWRTPIADGSSTGGITGQIRTVALTRNMIKKKIQDRKPDLVHAHSPCLNGLAALGHGVPLIYEMRSSWEDAAVSEGATREGSLRYRVSKQLETFVARKATAITVICDGLRRELENRGIQGDKITVVPNALPARIFELPSDEEVTALRGKLRLIDSKVIGFFGSFFQWEGVDDLVRVLPKVVNAVPNVRLLLAGGGRQERFLRNLVSELGVERYVLFAGRVPAAAMPTYYGLADVMVYPRLSNRLTEMVTPLKPLEAMAQNTPVLASDIGGHRELIDDGRTGFLFAPGDEEALASEIINVLQQQSGVDAIVRVARQEVMQDRRWESVARRYVDLYDRLARS